MIYLFRLKFMWQQILLIIIDNRKIWINYIYMYIVVQTDKWL